jgi:hypothetical protein
MNFKVTSSMTHITNILWKGNELLNHVLAEVRALELDPKLPGLNHVTA